CLAPDRLQYAELEDTFSATESFPVGAEVTYVCRPGYMAIPGKPRVRMCGKDLEWSPIEPFCTARRCRHPGELENGVVNVPSLTFGSAVTFSCDKGFRLRGTREISCVIKGKGVDWNRDLPFCERIPCDPPPSIANGHYTEADSYVYESSVSYTCNSVPKGQDPFSLIGQATILCVSNEDSNGVWSGPPPQCKVVKCDNPTVANGRKRFGFGPSYGYRDTVMFECNPGYFLNGSDIIECGENSTWLPPVPTCKKSTGDKCGHPGVVFGLVIPEKFLYNKGESVEIKCDSDCAFPDGTGEMTVTCEGQNTWTSLKKCECTKPTSGLTPHISNGQVIEGQKPSYSVGDFIRIECYTGYELDGEAQIQYEGGNQWYPRVPTCQLSKY
ncbi:C4BPA protein, partial [Atlantisia rogersi]|nr:C4BPA protein [Atlantisia rogersi]